MEPIISVKNISKKYNITHQQGGYVAMRDILTNIAKRPFKFIKHKAKKAVGKETKEEFWALKDISFTVEKGEAVGIIGANGAGKSTLLKILSKITPPTTGTIEYEGRMASLLEVGTGFHPELTGRENIFLNGAILGMTKKEIAEKFNDIVEFAGIEKFLDTPVKRYSSGMYVRLAFAVAAHMEPDILVVDEVLAVGDAEFQKKCLGKMDEVTKTAGRTILFVSHNMSAIQNLCKRCILLEGGEVKMIGETKKVVAKYINNMTELSKIPLKDREDRKGNRESKITNIRFLDAQSKESAETILTGQNIIAEISYESNEASLNIRNVSFSIVFTNKQGSFVTGLNSEMSSKQFKTTLNSGKVFCYIPKFPIMPGIYNIKLELNVGGVIIDQIENAHTVKVEYGDFYKTGIGNPYKRQGVFIENKWVSDIKTI